MMSSTYSTVRWSSTVRLASWRGWEPMSISRSARHASSGTSWQPVWFRSLRLRTNRRVSATCPPRKLYALLQTGTSGATGEPSRLLGVRRTTWWYRRPPVRAFGNKRPRGGYSDSPDPTERLSEPCEHHEVSVNPHPINAPSPKGCKPVLVLQPAELALDGPPRIPRVCAEPDCQHPLSSLAHARRRYCDQHRTGAARARRHRRASSRQTSRPATEH
jgi:hypothetical protein